VDLLRLRNADGGWGYYPGKNSRLEPTCWALLATSAGESSAPDTEVLQRWPRHGEWMADVPGAPVNYAFNALAALVLQADPATRPAGIRLAGRLAEVRGLALKSSDVAPVNGTLQAWPWIDATFSWVEPTTLCLLLLKKLRPHLPADLTRERIDTAERMLIDRSCAEGGWNYGSSRVYRQDLHPYVPTTALGLLAMQDRREEVAVDRALAWLQSHASGRQSSAGIALLALRAFDRDASVLAPEIAARAEAGSWRGVVPGAVAQYALNEPLAEHNVFRL